MKRKETTTTTEKNEQTNKKKEKETNELIPHGLIFPMWTILYASPVRAGSPLLLPLIFILLDCIMFCFSLGWLTACLPACLPVYFVLPMHSLPMFNCLFLYIFFALLPLLFHFALLMTVVAIAAAVVVVSYFSMLFCAFVMLGSSISLGQDSFHCCMALPYAECHYSFGTNFAYTLFYYFRVHINYTDGIVSNTNLSIEKKRRNSILASAKWSISFRNAPTKYKWIEKLKMYHSPSIATMCCNQIVSNREPAAMVIGTHPAKAFKSNKCELIFLTNAARSECANNKPRLAKMESKDLSACSSSSFLPAHFQCDHI